MMKIGMATWTMTACPERKQRSKQKCRSRYALSAVAAGRPWELNWLVQVDELLATALASPGCLLDVEGAVKIGPTLPPELAAQLQQQQGVSSSAAPISGGRKEGSDSASRSKNEASRRPNLSVSRRPGLKSTSKGKTSSISRSLASFSTSVMDLSLRSKRMSQKPFEEPALPTTEAAPDGRDVMVRPSCSVLMACSMTGCVPAG